MLSCYHVIILLSCNYFIILLSLCYHLCYHVIMLSFMLSCYDLCYHFVIIMLSFILSLLSCYNLCCHVIIFDIIVIIYVIMIVLVPIFSVNSPTELEENGSEVIKSKVASILEELFNRNAIRFEVVGLKQRWNDYQPVALAMKMITKIPQLYHNHDKIRQYGWYIP